MKEMTPELAALIARRFALLGEPMRLRLLSSIHGAGEASVGELAEAVGGSHANVSKHLGLMLGERMVTRRRDGARALYSLADPTLIALCDQVCTSMSAQLRELGLMIAAGEPETDPVERRGEAGASVAGDRNAGGRMAGAPA